MVTNHSRETEYFQGFYPYNTQKEAVDKTLLQIYMHQKDLHIITQTKDR